MRRARIIVLVMLCYFGISSAGLQAQSKLAQSSFQFLSVVSDARAGALGTAMTTINGNSSSLFFNPAGLAAMAHTTEFSASQNSWFADINHITFSAAYRPFEGRYGVFGVSYVSVDYGALQGTMVWGNEKGYLDTETFYPASSAIGMGYAKQLSDRFSIGAHVKYANQFLGRSVIPEYQGNDHVKKNLENVFAYDFGTLYRTEIRGLNFGMSVRNFSKEIQYEDNSFPLPLMFRIGLSIDAFETFQVTGLGQNFLITFDAVHPRSYPEYVNIGMEYRGFNDIIALRGGYSHNRDLEDFTFGFGISQFGINFDYSYTPFGIFDPIQRITVRVAI